MREFDPDQHFTGVLPPRRMTRRPWTLFGPRLRYLIAVVDDAVHTTVDIRAPTEVAGRLQDVGANRIPDRCVVSVERRVEN